MLRFSSLDPPQAIEFVEQIERQRNACHIYAQIVSQSIRAAGTVNAGAGKPPGRHTPPLRFEDAIIDQFDDLLGAHAAQAAQLTEGESTLVVYEFSLQHYPHHFCHAVYTPSWARGLKSSAFLHAS